MLEWSIMYQKSHIAMTFLQSYVGMELMHVHQHICHSCMTSILSHVMIEWSLIYVITNVTVVKHCYVFLQIEVGMEVICVYHHRCNSCGRKFFPM